MTVELMVDIGGGVVDGDECASGGKGGGDRASEELRPCCKYQMSGYIG